MNRDREAIARIIDPEAWARIDGLDANEHMPQAHKDICAASLSKRSLAKADAILALPPAGGVEEADLGKRLRETWAAYTKAGEPTDYVFRMVARAARAALSPTTLGEES